ncbi:MAG: 8-oxo-dGTP diphosphatase [Anaeroplasmataceae bacterium]|nr:8-oxo-dGTP diphosphatase [Anaeroplasmataceae bacterium]
MKNTTLCYICKDKKILMLYRNKKKIDVNKGKWIGVGGHFLEGETAEECLLREVYEETGLMLTQYRLMGKLNFFIDDIEEVCFLYKAYDFTGEIIDCDEGILEWIDESKILELPLWEGDYLFLNRLLHEDDYFEMTLIYKKDKMIEWRIENDISEINSNC